MQLVTLPPAFGLRNPSPFCLKAEMALTYLNLGFEIIPSIELNKAPKNKMPYLIIDGETLADSELILDYLDEQTQGGLYGKLTPQERAIGVAFSRLADDHLYWMGVASRWLDDDWFPNVVDGFFGGVPKLLRGVIANSARRTMAKTYHLQGLGRHTLEEQKAFARKDLQAIADVVSKHDYIVGGRLTVFDFAVASMLSGMMQNEPATWFSKIANGFPSLVAYVARVEFEVGVFGK